MDRERTTSVGTKAEGRDDAEKPGGGERRTQSGVDPDVQAYIGPVSELGT